MKKIINIVLIIVFIFSSVAAGNEIEVSSKEIEQEFKEVEIDLKIPVIKGMKNKKLESKINTNFEKEIINFSNQIKKEASKYLKAAKKEGWLVHPYIASTDYKVTYSQNNLLSIIIKYYQYTGGAHGNYQQESFNLNLKTGKQVPLKEILKKQSNYKRIINREIKQQIKKNDQLYFKDSFKGISDRQDFYLTPENIVIYFGLYEIAPYSTGIPTFKIPLIDFK